MQEREAVAFEALHDETLTAEEADADLLLEGNADGDSLGGAEKRVFLTNELSAHAMEIGGDDLPG